MLNIFFLFHHFSLDFKRCALDVMGTWNGEEAMLQFMKNLGLLKKHVLILYALKSCHSQRREGVAYNGE